MTVPGIEGGQKKARFIGDIPDTFPFHIHGGTLDVGGGAVLLGQAKTYKRKVFGEAGIMNVDKTLVHDEISSVFPASLV